MSSGAFPPSYGGHCAPHSTYIRRSSPPGSPGPRKCCFDSAGEAAGPAIASSSVDKAIAPGVLCCCYSCPGVKKRASVLASLGVCLLVVAYTVIGAFTFMALEGGVHHDTPIAASKHPASHHPLITELRSHTVDRLWSITENLNILYRENWTRLAAEEVLEFQEALVRALAGWGGSGSGPAAHTAPTVLLDHKHRWSFSSSFLYSLTLITTIGYGSVSPRTAWGKLVTILYALVGIPLMLVYLSTTGDVLARSFRRLYGKLCGVTPAKAPGGDCPCSATVKVPITLCLILVLSYICCGAVLFHRLENWSMLEGSYFCFTSLGTIGFGDLVPGQHAEEVSLCACSVYILAGMALVAMCVSLVQEEATSLLRLIGTSCGTPPHPSKEPLSSADDIPMSLVS